MERLILFIPQTKSTFLASGIFHRRFHWIPCFVSLFICLVCVHDLITYWDRFLDSVWHSVTLQFYHTVTHNSENKRINGLFSTRGSYRETWLLSVLQMEFCCGEMTSFQRWLSPWRTFCETVELWELQGILDLGETLTIHPLVIIFTREAVQNGEVEAGNWKSVSMYLSFLLSYR